MKKLAILILALATFSMAKEIEIDVENATTVKISNAVEYMNARNYCSVYNDTAKTATRCTIHHDYEKTGRKVQIEIIEYKCPHLLPRPLAVYHKTGNVNTLQFHAWAEACGKLQNFSMHYVENGIEFLKPMEVKSEKITFLKVK